MQKRGPSRSKIRRACAEYGFALMKLGRAVDALQQIMHATELDVNSATAWQYRGELEWNVGRPCRDRFIHSCFGEESDSYSATKARSMLSAIRPSCESRGGPSCIGRTEHPKHEVRNDRSFLQ
jgi:hypothetical protein